MENKLLDEIIADLGEMYENTDASVLKNILNDVINDALYVSNRQFAIDKSKQITLLRSNIKKAVKTIYLQRGVEDVNSDSQSGMSKSYDIAIETMKQDIIRQNKRLLI